MRIHSPKEMGLLVREERRRLGLTQQTLAEQAGVTRQWVRMLEQGKPRLELGLTLRALTALGLNLDVQGSSPSAPSAKAQTQVGTSTLNPGAEDIDIDAIVLAATGFRK